ncbi:MAG: hypothetical protein ACKOVA_01900 [Novosphingobium sp.]
MALDPLAAHQRSQLLFRNLAALPALAPAVAGLRELRGIDPGQPDAVAVDLKRISVHRHRRTGDGLGFGLHRQERGDGEHRDDRSLHRHASPSCTYQEHSGRRRSH